MKRGDIYMPDTSLYNKIQEAKEKIGDDAVDLIAKHFHLDNFSNNGTVIKASCPFGHIDKTPSFIWNAQEKYFHCFSCGKNYGILDLLIDEEKNTAKAIKKLFQMADIDYKFQIKEDNEDFFEGYCFPPEETNTDRSKVDEYCAKRGISTKTLDDMGIKQDKRGNIVFELRDLDNRLLSIKYRPSRKVKKSEPKMWWYQEKDAHGNNKRSVAPSLFNMNKIDFTKPLLITEGYFDALSCYEAGYKNVVSIYGGAEDDNWIQFNFDFLEQFQEIILWYDNDSAGKAGLDKAVSRLGEYRCKIVSPTTEHEDAVEEYFQLLGSSKDIRKTDANNILLACGKEAVLNLIKNAKEIPSKRLKYLMDYEPTNVKDMEKVSTGFKSIDRLIYGNLFPCFTIWSGYAGSGKSSLANIACLIAPVEHDYKVFVYSGELDNGQLSDWIFSPLAGIRHTLMFDNPNGRPSYAVSKEALKCIRDFYRTKFILYDDEDGLDSSGETVLKEMENAYRKYNCRVFLIDNLMTLSFDQLTEDSRWETQKKFIKKLMGFTKKYNVNVNLIVHPKKPAVGATLEHSVYDLHGASEIGNLCHRLIWIDRLKDDDFGYNTKISIVKDRPSQAAGRECKLYYDYATRRLYSDIEELEKEYNWESHYTITYSNEVEKKRLCNIPREECDQF
jgi:twinkle protein